MGTGAVVSTGDLITAAKMNLKLEGLNNLEEDSTFAYLRFRDLSGALPAGTVAYIGGDNTNDVTINALVGGIIGLALAGTDEFTVSATAFTVLAGNFLDFDLTAAAWTAAIRDVNNNELLDFYATAAAVNQLGVQNQSTGVLPSLHARGEASIGILFYDSNGNELARFGSVLNAVNEVTILNAATGNRPRIRSQGEADRGLVLASYDGTTDEEILILAATATAVNEVTITSAAIGARPDIAASGDDANIGLTLSTVGTGIIQLRSATTARVAVNNAYSLTLYQATADYTLAWADPAAARTLTIPDPLGADTFAFLAAAQTLTNKTITGGTFSGTIAGTPTYSGAATYTSTITINGTNIDIVINAENSPILDIGPDVFPTGVVIDIDMDTAETLTGALTGIDVDLGTNVTTGGAGTGNITGLHVDFGPLTVAGAYNGTLRGLFIEVDPTVGGAETIIGLHVTTPATFGAGTEVGARIAGDGATVDIVSDADLYLSLTKANTVDILVQGVSPVLDIGADVFASGTFIDIAYDTAETLTGATRGLNIDLGTNVTSMGAGEGNLTAIHIDLGPLALAAAFNGTVYGIHLEADPTLTDENITGVLVTMSGTFAAGTEIGVSVTGDGQTVNIVNDADLYISMAKASTVDINLQAVSPVVDIGADVFASGTFIDIAYDTAETLTGAIIGINLNLNTNVTLSGQNINGIIVAMPATYGAGAEVGIQVTGDGQTINIGNDADLYASFAKANSVDVNIQGISPVIDIGADVLENGVIIDVDYDSAETLSGASLTGVDLNFNTNVTNTEDTDVYGYRVQFAGLTQSGAVTTLFYGFDLGTAGALVQDTAAGTLTWRGVNIQLPNTTQTTGTVTAFGLYVTEGTTTSGTVAGLGIDVDVAIDLITLGNRIDLDADNDTSLRASADDILLWEIAATDRIQMSLDTGAATGLIKSAGATEIGFCVTNGALTVGSLGSIVIPVSAGVLNDGSGGDLDGALAVNITGNTLSVRDTTWLTVAVAGYVIQANVPWVASGDGWYHPAQMWGEVDEKGRERIDETVCPVCGDSIEPGDGETSRAVAMYPNAYTGGGYRGRRDVHAIFGHAHIEREPAYSTLQERVEALEEALRILESENERLRTHGRRELVTA